MIFFIRLPYFFMLTWLNETNMLFRYRGYDIGMNTWRIKIKMQIIFFGYNINFSFLSSLQRSAYPNCRNVYIHDRSTFYNDTSQRDRWMDITNQICSKARCRVSSKYMGGGLSHKLCMQMSLSDFFCSIFSSILFSPFSLYDCQISTQPVKSYSVRLNLVSKYETLFFHSSASSLSFYALCLTSTAVDLKKGEWVNEKSFWPEICSFLQNNFALFC